MRLDGRNIAQELVPFSTSPRVFHKLLLKNGTAKPIECAVYLTTQVVGQAVLERQYQFAYNTLEVYAIRLGVGGIFAGYLFRSPLMLKLDPYYVTFFRRGLKPVDDLIMHPTSVEKRHVLGDLVFHVHELSYMITRLETNGVTEMLSH